MFVENYISRISRMPEVREINSHDSVHVLLVNCVLGKLAKYTVPGTAPLLPYLTTSTQAFIYRQNEMGFEQLAKM